MSELGMLRRFGACTCAVGLPAPGAAHRLAGMLCLGPHPALQQRQLQRAAATSQCVERGAGAAARAAAAGGGDHQIQQARAAWRRQCTQRKMISVSLSCFQPVDDTSPPCLCGSVGCCPPAGCLALPMPPRSSTLPHPGWERIHAVPRRVYLASPDGVELVRELSFEVQPGRSVLIMGPNGSGKSSLFRCAPASMAAVASQGRRQCAPHLPVPSNHSSASCTFRVNEARRCRRPRCAFACVPHAGILLPHPRRVAAGLWPLQAGEVTLPPKGELFYLSQRPYLVAGTLRDQLLYPEPPRAVYAASRSERARACVEPWMRSLALGEEELEERLRWGRGAGARGRSAAQWGQRSWCRGVRQRACWLPLATRAAHPAHPAPARPAASAWRLWSWTTC